jgi:hypothetical protein
MPTTTTVPMDDKEIFESATTPEVKDVTNEKETAETKERARDEAGKFAKAEKVEAKPAVTEVKPDAKAEDKSDKGNEGIPSWRLKEEMDAKRRYEDENRLLRQQLAQINERITKQEAPKTEAPEIWEDPNKWGQTITQQAISPLQEELQNMRETFSRSNAEIAYGADKVAEAYEAMGKDLEQMPQAQRDEIISRLKKHPHPFGEIVKWHQNNQTLSKVGNDPQKWLDAEKEKWLSDPAEQAKILERIRGSAQTRPSVTNLPPSLNRVSSAGNGLDDSGDLSNESLFAHATAR